MDKDPIVALYTQDQRIDVQYPSMRREVVENIVRQVNTAPDGDGAVIYSRLDETDVEDTIREQVSYFESIGQDFERSSTYDSTASPRSITLFSARRPDWGYVDPRVHRLAAGDAAGG